MYPSQWSLLDAYTKVAFQPQGGIFLFLYKTTEYLHNLNNFLHLNVFNFFYDSRLTDVQIPSYDVRLHLSKCLWKYLLQIFYLPGICELLSL